MRIPRSYDVVALLVELGLQDVEQREDEVFALCPEPSHEDTRAGSWSLNAVTGDFYCFACGFSGGLPRLVALQRNMVLHQRGPDGERIYNLDAAHRWVEQRVSSLEGAADRLAALTYERVGPDTAPPMGEERLMLYDPPPAKELSKRGITAEAAALYGVLWDSKKAGWILPIRNPRTTELWGWQLKSKREFRNHPPGVRKSDTVFGLDCFTGERAVLVESPLDAVRLASAGVAGGLATYGAAFSRTQLGLICDVADELVVALDNDAAGQKAAYEILRTYSRQIDLLFLDYSVLGDVKDIGDSPHDEDIRKAVARARHAVRGKAAIRVPS